MGGQNEKDKTKSDRDRNHRIDRSSGKIFQHAPLRFLDIDGCDSDLGNEPVVVFTPVKSNHVD
jgi:hypothetical protein